MEGVAPISRGGARRRRIRSEAARYKTDHRGRPALKAELNGRQALLAWVERSKTHAVIARGARQRATEAISRPTRGGAQVKRR